MGISLFGLFFSNLSRKGFEDIDCVRVEPAWSGVR